MSGNAGTIENPFRMVIVGGGPAGTAIIIRALRLNMLDALAAEVVSNDMRTAGVCFLDASQISRFGGGRLQDYVINRYFI